VPRRQDLHDLSVLRVVDQCHRQYMNSTIHYRMSAYYLDPGDLIIERIVQNQFVEKILTDL
jgi:hypothetical protein